MNIAVFTSHNGTDLQAIIDGYKMGYIDANVNVVISNNENAMPLERARKENIPNYYIYNKDFNNDDELSTRILEVLNYHNTDIIFLAGYLKKIGTKILDEYENRIFNIHPSLLPKYGGKGMYGINIHRKVIEQKEKVTGITIHKVSKEYDKGEIIAQTEVIVLENDTPETLQARVLEREHEFIVEVIQQIINDKKKY